MSIPEIRCPACQRKITVSYKIADGEDVTMWFQCFCQTVFHNRGINKDVFDQEYLKKWLKMKEVELRYDYFMRTYLPLIEDLTYGRKFLDVGFTLPFNIKSLANRGWIATGIDLIKNDYITGDFETFKFSDTFDFILMGHCLESFEKPIQAIKKAYELLNPDGILVITTPNPELINLAGLKEFGHWQPKEKWVFFSKRALKRIASYIGFKWVFARRNVSQRYVIWHDLHLILQKDKRCEE